MYHFIQTHSNRDHHLHTPFRHSSHYPSLRVPEAPAPAPRRLLQPRCPDALSHKRNALYLFILTRPCSLPVLTIVHHTPPPFPLHSLIPFNPSLAFPAVPFHCLRPPSLPSFFPPVMRHPPRLSLMQPLLVSLLLLAASATILRPHHSDWAALLRADKYDLIKAPSRYTYASHFNDSLHRLQIHLPSARMQVYQGRPANSQFEFTVFTPPSTINMDRVMAKVIAVLSDAWVSPVPVRVKLAFADLGSPEVLARGGGTYFVKINDRLDTLLPVAVAEVIRGKDLNGNEQGDGRYDVLITCNNRTPWYDGDGGNPPANTYDLITVILHEVYHNFIFAGSIVVDVVRDPTYPGGVRQTATIFRNYRTRYDSFLANEDSCAILDYLNDRALAQRLNRTTNELLAESVVNGKLYFSMGDRRVVRIYAPRVFKPKSSAYHLDVSTESENSLMAPSIRSGYSQHSIGPTIINMQKIILNPSYTGARRCPFPLANPIAGTDVTDDDFDDGETHDDTRDEEDIVLLPVEEESRRIAGLPVWAFALILVFAILLALLLLGLCLALCLKKRKNRVNGFPYTHSRTTSSRTSNRTSTYKPGIGNITSRYGRSRTKSSQLPGSDNSFRETETSKRVSTKVGSKYTHGDGHGSSKKTSKTSRKSDYRGDAETCRISGKTKIHCTCRVCCRESSETAPTPPPPIASVHTFDSRSMPSTRKCSQRRIHRVSKHKKRCHNECHCAYPCKYKASSSSSSKCKASKKASRAAPPSTKPPTHASSTKCSCAASSSKATSSRVRCSCKSTHHRSVPSTKAPTKTVGSKCKPCPPAPKCPPAPQCPPVRRCAPTPKTCRSGMPGAAPCACKKCVVEINVMRC